MHVTSVLAFGVVFMTLLRGCEAVKKTPWNMRFRGEMDAEKIHCMKILGLEVTEKEGDGAPSQSATDLQSSLPRDLETHMTTMDREEDDVDRGLWENFDKKSKPSEVVGACLSGDQQSHSLFRQYVNHLRNLIKEKVKEKYGESIGWTNDFVVGVSMDSEKLRVMEKFGADEYNLDSLRNVHEVMINMLLYVHYPQHESKSWIEKNVGWTPKQTAMLLLGSLFLLMLPKLLKIARSFFRLSWIWLILLFIVVSFLWKGYAIYLRELVKTEVALSQNYGKACVQPVTFWQRITKGFFFTKDDCHDFHYHTMIDPIWKISPLQVVGECLFEVMWIPVSTSGEPIAKFVNDLFGRVPFYVWPVAGGFVVFFFLLFITWVSGSSLRLFYGMIHIGERPKKIESQAHDDLRAKYEALKLEMADLQQENALLLSRAKAIEMNAGGDARPANRLAGVPPKKAIKGAKNKIEKEHIGNGSAAVSSYEYSNDSRHADNIGPRSSTDETRRCSTEARGGQGDTQNSTNHNATRDRKYDCQIDTESDSSQENDSGPETQASAGGEGRCRATKTDSPRPVTVASSL